MTSVGAVRGGLMKPKFFVAEIHKKKETPGKNDIV